MDIFKITVEANLEPLFGQAFVARLFKVLNFSTKALSAMGNEIFRLTDETRGGLLLILILFYAAFVVAAALWTETEGKGECSSIALCMFTLMRLTFYDDIGFDYAFSLTEKHKFLFTIVMLYLIMTSLGILNGLVGIFGTVFARSSHLAFDDDAEELEEEEQSLLGDEEDEFPMKHDDKNSSDNNKLSIGTDFANIVNADKKEQDEDGSSNDDDDESVGLYSPSKSERSLMTSNFNITPVKPVGLVPIRQKSTTMRTMPSRNSKQSFKNVVQQRLISQAFQSAIADTSKTVKGGAVVSAGDSISENTNDVENNKPITSFNVKAKPQIGLFTQSFAKLPKPAQPSGGPTVPIEVNAYIRELNSKVQVLQNKLDGEGEMLDSFVQKMRAYATKKGIDVDALIPNNN